MTLLLLGVTCGLKVSYIISVQPYPCHAIYMGIHVHIPLLSLAESESVCSVVTPSTYELEVHAMAECSTIFLVSLVVMHLQGVFELHLCCVCFCVLYGVC